MKKLDFKVFKFKDKINFIIPKNDQRSRIAGSIYSKYYYYLVVTECLLCNNGDYVKFVIGVYKNDINIIIVDVDESWKTVYIDKIKEMYGDVAYNEIIGLIEDLRQALID